MLTAHLLLAILVPSTEQERDEMAKSAYDFESQVAGIPCKVLFTKDEFTILDRHGYQAPWIEKKLSKDDVERLEKEYEGYLKAQLEDY